jgi:hypothetical protein
MAYKLQLKRGASGSLPTGIAGEPLFTTDTNDLYIGTGASNQRYQKYIASGTSSQFLKGDGSLDSNTYYLASNPSAYIALTALTASSPLSYNNTTGAFTIAQASGSVSGFLSSTDWTTFNNKQNTITNPVTGTGTTNYLPKWTSGSALGNSLVQDNGTTVSINKNPSYPVFVAKQTQSTYYQGITVEASSNDSQLQISHTGSLAVINSTYQSTAGYSPLAFYVSDAEQMRLTSTGLVIGDTSNSEAAKLKVKGGYVYIKETGGADVYLRSGYNGIQAAIQVASDSDLVFVTQNNTKMTLTASGNLGLSVVPSAWTNCKAIDISTIGSVFADGFSQNNQAGFATNAYRAGAAVWFYKGTAAATYYAQDLGTHKWFNAPSGTAGNAISFTQAMTLNASGNLSLGNTNDTHKLDVSGTGRFSGQLTASTTAGGTSAIFQNTGAQNSNGIELRGGTSGTAVNWKIEKDNTVGNAFQITPSTTNGGTTYTTPSLTIASTGAATFSSTIQTAAPSGGTAKPFKIGAAASVSPTSPNRTIEIEIDGTTYYLSAKTTND